MKLTTHELLFLIESRVRELREEHSPQDLMDMQAAGHISTEELTSMALILHAALDSSSTTSTSQFKEVVDKLHLV